MYVYIIQSPRLSHPNWLPRPLTCKRLLPLPPLFPGGGEHPLAGDGVGDANLDEGTDTLVLKV